MHAHQGGHARTRPASTGPRAGRAKALSWTGASRQSGTAGAGRDWTAVRIGKRRLQLAEPTPIPGGWPRDRLIAVAADLVLVLDACKSTEMVDQEAAGAGELVLLPGK